VRNAPVLVSVCTIIEPLPAGVAGVVLTLSHWESVDTVQVQLLLGAVTVTGQSDSMAPE
jgi:hypothetical protein